MSARNAEPSRRRSIARITLAGLAVLAVVSVGLTLSPFRMGFADLPRPDEPDVAGYYGAIERMHDGATYYEALGAELTTRGYPTASPFNWRMPLPVALLAKLPSPDYGRLILAVVGALMLFFGYRMLSDMGGFGTKAIGLVLLTGPIIPGLVGILYVQPVLWAGLFLALSVVLRGAGYTRASIAVGLVAPFLREFAIVWVVVCLGFALLERRRGEAIAWLAGMVAFGAMVAYHAVQVGRHLSPGAFSQPDSWFQFGTIPFVVSTFQMSGYFLLLPQWAAALLLVLVLAGMIGWTSPVGRRATLTMTLFIVSFSIIGIRYNQYWGLVFAPLACLFAARAPAVLRSLWRDARLQLPAGRPTGDWRGAPTPTAE